MAFRANYPGQCSRGDSIEKGDLIEGEGIQVSGNRGRQTYRHVGTCPDHRQPARRNPEREAHEAVAMQWAMDRYGPEGVYADGERGEREARTWAVREYDRHQAAKRAAVIADPDPNRQWAGWKGLHADREREQEAAAFLSDPDYAEYLRTRSIEENAEEGVL